MVLGTQLPSCPLHILNRCGATVAPDQVVSDSGVALLGPLQCGRSVASGSAADFPRAAGTALWSHQGTWGAGRCSETATRRRNRPRSANQAGRLSIEVRTTVVTARCAGRRRTGPTPPLSRAGELLDVATGKAPNCAGWPNGWPTCRYIPDSPPVGSDCGPLSSRATGPCDERRKALRAPFRSGQGFPLVYAGRRGSRRPRRW